MREGSSRIGLRGCWFVAVEVVVGMLVVVEQMLERQLLVVVERTDLTS